MKKRTIVNPLFDDSHADRHFCSLCIDTYTRKYR